MKLKIAAILFLSLFSLASCWQEPRKTDAFPVTINKPDGIIAFGEKPENYPFPNTPEGYKMAGNSLKNPLPATKENILKGEQLFMALCQQCHGFSGKSDAPMILKGKYPPPPKFSKRLPGISDGNIFHSLTYGKNLMPGNKDELTSGQRWLLVLYLRSIVPEADSIKTK